MAILNRSRHWKGQYTNSHPWHRYLTVGSIFIVRLSCLQQRARFFGLSLAFLIAHELVKALTYVARSIIHSGTLSFFCSLPFCLCLCAAAPASAWSQGATTWHWLPTVHSLELNKSDLIFHSEEVRAPLTGGSQSPPRASSA